MRIVKWQYKLLYVVASFLLGHVIFSLLVPHGPGLTVLGGVYDWGIIFVGARIFRGRSEDITAPRDWWRMTSKRTLSRRLGILFTVLTVLAVGGSVLYASHIVIGTRGAMADAAEQASSALFSAVLAFFYLNCAARLDRVPTPTPVAPMGPA